MQQALRLVLAAIVPVHCRSTLSPKTLVTSFEPPGESIGTLYDNFENAMARYPNVRTVP
jgi:hypothetical protein